MAVAKKCDKCGQFYERNTNGWAFNGVYVAGITLDYSASHSSKSYDLCDSCISKLRFFLENPEAGIYLGGERNKED